MEKYRVEKIIISPEVKEALHANKPVVALESTVISHGLPYPNNYEIANELQAEIRHAGSMPATIGIVDGEVIVGLSRDQIELLAKWPNRQKISCRDLGPAIVKKWTGGTTVSATSHVAYQVGIRVFATGGIGGVHRTWKRANNQRTFDISADLVTLSRTPIIVVCSGAKSILDISATLEYLETYSVPVIGYQTHEFPAFFTNESGLETGLSADSIGEIIEIARTHWALDLTSAILVANPLPASESLDSELIEKAIYDALSAEEFLSIVGKDVTPYLLKKVSENTRGLSLKANLVLLKNNARLAGLIAASL